MKTIDCTPKWEALHKLYADWVDSGNDIQKQLVKDELLKLCKIADRVNALKIDLSTGEKKS